MYKQLFGVVKHSSLANVNKIVENIKSSKIQLKSQIADLELSSVSERKGKSSRSNKEILIKNNRIVNQINIKMQKSLRESRKKPNFSKNSIIDSASYSSFKSI